MKRKIICTGIYFMILAAIAACVSVHDNKVYLMSETMNYLETFKVNTCDIIIMEYYKKMSAPMPATIEEINDDDEIKEILALLKRLPEKGDMMIKMGDVPVIKVTLFYQGKGIGFFKYYQSKLKMIDTSFCSEQSEEEVALYRLLKEKLKINW